MSEDLLRRALVAFDARRIDAAREALVGAWRRRRSPRIARFVELLDTSWPDELPARLRAVIAPRAAASLARLQELDDVDDPRLGRFAVDALAQLPFTTPAAQPFLEHLVETAERLRDVRLVERASAIREGMRVRLTRAPMRDALVARLERAVAVIGRSPPVTPVEVELQLEEQLEAKLAPLGESARAADALLAEIYANPSDDAPRRVYGDWLLDRGDPRGELIALQFQRRDGGLTPEGHARETELLKRHGKAWLGTLAPVVSFGKGYAKTTFERGFLAVADIIGSVGKKLEPLWDDPAWSTVEEFAGWLWPFDLLERAPLRGLRRISRSIGREAIERLARRNERLGAVRSILLLDLTGIERTTLLEAFPALDEIELVVPEPSAAQVLAAAKLGVRRVRVTPHAGDSEAARARFAALLRDLASEDALVDELALTPPFARWPLPPPVVLVRRDGRWARSDDAPAT